MADRTFYPSTSYGLGRVYCEFQFLANGASAPALSSVAGADCVSAMTHSGGTQIIGITLKDKFNRLIYASAESLESDGTNTAVGAGDWCTCSMPTNNEASTSNITFNIKTWQAGGTARNDQTGRIQVCLAFRNTKQMPGAGAV